MEAWKKAQENYNNQEVVIQIDKWRQRKFKNFDEYMKYINKRW